MERSLQTEDLAYEPIAADSQKAVTIGFSFTNHEVYAVEAALGCNGQIHTRLEVEQNDRWITAWNSVDHGCPNFVRIEPGQTVVGSVSVVAHDAGTPRFQVDSIPGLYRLVWEGPAHYENHLTGWRLTDSLPTAVRTSNRFLLRLRTPTR
jgi:hypothetical protein